MPAPNVIDSLAQDTAEFAGAIQDLLRIHQLRDRERICCYDITVSECYALEALMSEGPATLNQLAARLRLDKSTTSRVVRALEHKKYVRCTPDPEDRRALRIAASPAGAELTRRIATDLEARYRQLLAHLDSPTRRAVTAVLRELHTEACCQGNPKEGQGCC